MIQRTLEEDVQDKVEQEIEEDNEGSILDPGTQKAISKRYL